METLQIKKENAIKAYNSGCNDVKTVLSNLFGKETFVSKNIMDIVKTFDDARDAIGIKSTPTSCGNIKTNPLSAGDLKSSDAYLKLIVIARALNEGWTPDWGNSNQYKYYPWFDLSSGCGLSCDDFGYLRSDSLVGSRLCFKSRELAEYAGKQFIELYKEFFLI